MSSRKARQSQRKLDDKRRRRQKRVEKKQTPSTFGDHDHGGLVIDPPPGFEKMSVIIGEFVKPELEPGQDIDQVRRIVGLSVLAWNIAILPATERDAAIDSLISKLSPGASSSDRATIREVIESLVVRKLMLFPTIDRTVYEYEVRDQGVGKEFYLSVISSPPGLPTA